jgi:integrase
MRKYLMTYIPSRKGWMKEYRGKKYAVSCAQLQCAPSKEQSWQAANAWWEQKQADLDAAEKPPSVASVMDQISAALGVAVPPDLAAQLLALRNQTPLPSITVAQAVEDWQRGLLMSVNAKNMDISRYDAYRRYISRFVAWVGGDSDVRVIDAKKLEEWWAYLGVCLADEKYRPATCQQLLMTTKQFIRHVSTQGLIPTPSNLADRRLRIRVPVRAVETLTVQEVRKLLDCEGSERAKLFVLLMLNCGMLQSDISDLGESEVDWARAVVTRPRSKRSDGVVTRYMLWDETLDLLKKYRAKKKVPNDRGDCRVLLTELGTPLVDYRQEGGKMRRKDNIHGAYKRLAAIAGVEKSIKYLRKTSATLLGTHPQYKYYVDYFLSHTPKSVSARHYVLHSAQFARHFPVISGGAPSGHVRP